MALPINIDDLVNGKTVENVRIEFKRGWNPEEILHTICAFSNDIKEYGGGYIVVGIEAHNGVAILPPYGIEQNQIDSIQREFTEICYKIKDSVSPTIEPLLYSDKWIIIIWVTTGEIRPYSAPSTLGERAQMKVYIRDGSITRIAKRSEEDHLREISRFRHFDDRINLIASIQDLDLGLIQSYLQEIKSDLYKESLSLPMDQLSLKMQIARGPKENIKPLNVGLLMFNKEPHKFFDGCKTNLIEFEDAEGIKYSEKVFVGPVHIQIRNIMSYLSSNIIKQYTNKSTVKPEADTYFNYPYQALEEVIVNSIYHRSFEEQRPNEIRIYKVFKPTIDNILDNRRIEVRSYPGPLPPIDSQSLTQLVFTSRNYRNIKLGDWLKNIHLAEKYATGIPTILQSLKENGSPTPIFWTDEQKSEFLVTIKIHSSTPYNGENSYEVNSNVKLSNIQQHILEHLTEAPILYKKLRAQFQQNISTDLDFLIKNQYIGKQKSFFKTFYYITQNGLNALKRSF